MKKSYACFSIGYKLKENPSFNQLLLYVVFTMFLIISSTCFCNASMMYLDQPVTKDKLCNFIVLLYRDLGDYGCCVESPITENNTCYTSTNLLAEYVLRNICGRSDLANKIKLFLNKYPTDFYDYYQVLLSRNIELPFNSVEHVQVDNVRNIRVFHVKKTNVTISDYDNYANLIVLKAIHHIANSEKDEAIVELDKLSKLFDGYGFADLYYGKHGKYEAYKIALAIISYKTLGYVNEAEKYINVLFNISPYTTLYEPGFKGTGDLNLETATLTAMALYSNIYNEIQRNSTSYKYGIVAVLIATLSIVILTTYTKLSEIILKRKTQRRN